MYSSVVPSVLVDDFKKRCTGTVRKTGLFFGTMNQKMKKGQIDFKFKVPVDREAAMERVGCKSALSWKMFSRVHTMRLFVANYIM